MNTALTHRGPDDEGVWVGDQFAFGMRRLSIIDLSGGRQPMWDPRTGAGIVYNGEIYNYRTVRAQLEKKGTSFQTTSDTEVVLHSLAEKGEDAVHDWNGMFAVAQWKEREKELLLIRDRVGIKPLYYYWNGSVLMFASELKAFLASSIFPRMLNRQAVWDYLTYRYVPEPETIWENVWKLAPGCMLRWRPGQEPRVSRYWQTDVISELEPLDIKRREREFEELFLDSVKQRLLAADVPVGVMLSGGLDSSAVAAAAVELGHKEFHTFSVGFSDGGRWSELGFARQVAKHLGLHSHEVVVDQSSFLQMLPQAVKAADEPLADLTIVPLLAVSRLARERVKVVLSGEGADETLAGYALNQFQHEIETVQRIQRLPTPLLKLLCTALPLASKRLAAKLARASSIPLQSWNLAHENSMTWEWTENEKAILWPEFAGADSHRVLAGLYGRARSKHPLDQLLHAYQQSWLVEDLLMKADKITMAASLELRVPFLDYRLVEWCNRQPLGVKVGRSGMRYETKHVLRRFARKRLPREITERPKRGFPVPVYHWLQEERFGRWALDHLTGPKSRLTQMFNVEPMQTQLYRSTSGDLAAAHKAWVLLVFETWLREYDVQVQEQTSSAVHLAAR